MRHFTSDTKITKKTMLVDNHFSDLHHQHFSNLVTFVMRMQNVRLYLLSINKRNSKRESF